MTDALAAAPVTAQDLDADRGIRLARPVGWVCTAGLLALYSVFVIFGFTRFPHLRGLLWPLGVGWAACIYFILNGLILARRRQGNWAARFMVTGIQGAIFVLQLVWVQTHGVDAVVLALCMAHIIPIGLGSVLDSAPLMFVTTGVTTLMVTGLLFGWPTLPLAARVVSWLVILVLAWCVALLVYGSSVAYVQSLDEMGALRVAYDRVRQLDALKDQFITHVNHELRTPIMTLQGTIEFLQATYTQLPPDQAELTLAQAQRSAARLVHMLSSVLDVRQIEREAQSFEPEAVDVTRAVAAARDLVDLQDHPLTVDVPRDLAIWGEQGLLVQILVNLLGNAIKYSPKGAPIHVTAELTATAPAQGQRAISLAVSDAGFGIPPEQAGLLFERFVRLPRDLASTIPGSGVGLYLCRVLTEAMGGTISVSSTGKMGEGSTFTLTLPAPPDDALVPTAPRARAAQRASR